MSTDPLYDYLNTINHIKIPSQSLLEFEARIDTKYLNSVELNGVASKIISHHITKKGDECSIEQSINFYKTDTTRANKYIKQLIFVNGIQKKELQNCYRKEVISDPIYIHSSPGYKITSSFEHKIADIDIKECQYARIRLRFSIISESFKEWRFDITMVKEINDISNTSLLKKYKDEMLYPIEVSNFVQKAPWNYCDSIEFEIEFIGKHLSIEVLKRINYILNEFQDNEVDDNEISTYQKYLVEMAKWIAPRDISRFRSGKYGMKQLGNQVYEMNKNIYLRDVKPHITNYYITDKVDGYRALIYSGSNFAVAMTDKETDLNFTTSNICILDTEEYEGSYYVFDVIVWQGTSLVNQSFEKRLEYFDEAIKLSKKFKKKPFVRLTDDYRAQIKSLKAEKKAYETDGFILTPSNGTYVDMIVYKYKPIDKITIDFLIKKCPSKLLGIKPYIKEDNNTLYLLFCGISKNVFLKLRMEFIRKYNDIFPLINTHSLPQYFPIQFEPSDYGFMYLYRDNRNDLDGEVGEFRWNKNKWEMLKIRTDRKIEVERGTYFGNNYKIAETTWLNYQSPLIIEELEDDSKSYFKESNSEIHKPSRNFNSFVKSKIFEQFKGTPWVMDMASGKGQDLFRYARYNVGKVLFLEIDQLAIMELISRKHSFSTDYNALGSLGVYVHNLDLNAPYRSNIQELKDSDLPIPHNGFDLIVCNLAFHYFLSSTSSVINITKFISHYLKPGGRFVFTAFNGQAVFDLLNENNGEWMALPRYSIKSAYKNNQLIHAGQKIQVLLPFSREEYYDEYLVNIEFLEKEFAKYNMTLENSRGYAEWLDDYKTVNARGYNDLDDIDKKYIGLYHAYYFYKSR